MDAILYGGLTLLLTLLLTVQIFTFFVIRQHRIEQKVYAERQIEQLHAIATKNEMVALMPPQQPGQAPSFLYRDGTMKRPTVAEVSDPTERRRAERISQEVD